MKRSHAEKLAIALAILTAATLTGCGKSGSTTPVSPFGTGAGLLPGQPGYGAVGSAGCIPITQPIGFYGSGVYIDNVNIIAGQTPQGSVGQMVVTAGSAGGQFTRNGSDGYISMNISTGSAYGGQPYAGYGGGYQTASQGQIQGSIQLNQTAMQLIMTQMGYNPYSAYSPYGGAPSPGYGYQQQIPCVSAISMNVGYAVQSQIGPTIYGGNVYLFLNGTGTPYTMPF